MATELERLTSTPKGKRLLEQERLILQVTEFIVQLMQEQNVKGTVAARQRWFSDRNCAHELPV